MRADVELHLGSTVRRVDGDRAVVRQDRGVQLCVPRGGDFDHDVHSVWGSGADLGDCVLLAIVDDGVCPGCEGELRLGIGRDGRDDGSAGPASELNGCVSDGASPARDEHGPVGECTGGEPRGASVVHGERAMRRQGGHAQRCADVERDAFGKGCDEMSGHDRVLLSRAGGALECCEKHPDPVAGRELLHARADGVDDAGAILVGHLFRKARRGRGAARAALPVRRIDARNDHTNPDLALAGLGDLSVDLVEDVGCSGLGVDDGAHGVGNRPAPSGIPVGSSWGAFGPCRRRPCGDVRSLMFWA